LRHWIFSAREHEFIAQRSIVGRCRLGLSGCKNWVERHGLDYDTLTRQVEVLDVKATLS
jgi:hypothetical protein